MVFLSTICVAAIAAALFKILVPENKFSKQLSLLTAGVFLLVGITAFSGAELDLDISAFEEDADDKMDDFSSGVNERLREEICGKMEEKVRALLMQSEIYPEQIHVIVNISGLYGIDITEIRIVLKEDSTEELAHTAENLLKRELSENVKITVSVKR
ncbi:MAG: hypothetical protein J1F03_01255 [Oscillospiraceae bacterium]|nr:hypothetical protein [Oscillospiraceae bacterium]